MMRTYRREEMMRTYRSRLRREMFWSLLVLAAGVAIFVLSGFRGKIVPDETALRALETQGFRDVQIIDRTMFMPFTICRGEAVRFKASAINPAGHRVIIYVCAGWPLKGATVRTD